MNLNPAIFPGYVAKDAHDGQHFFRGAPHSVRGSAYRLFAMILTALLAAPASASAQGGVGAVRRLSRAAASAALAQAQTPSLVNGSFETPAFASGFQYTPSGSSWSFASAGISKNSSAFTNGNPPAPEGTQVGFMQGAGAFLSQQVSGFQPGLTYIVKFATAQRGNCCNAGGLDFQVLVDNNSLGTFRPAGKNYVEAATLLFTATATTHTLKFHGLNTSGGDNSAFIDNVRIEAATQPPPVTVANGGFETPALSSGHQSAPSAASWLFVSAGVSKNSSAFTSGNPPAPVGTQVGYIQGAGSFAQMVSSFRAGVSYSISFKAAQRGNCCNAGGLDFDIYLDSVLLGTFKPVGTSYTALSTAAFTTGAGAHVLKFVGKNTSGGDNTAFFDDVQVNRLTANDPPAVGITAPAGGSTFTAPTGVNISASASDLDGQVMKVEFFQNGTKIGEDYSAPFGYNWAGVPAGSYALTAKATDDLGAQTTSAAVSVTVNPEKGTVAGRVTRADGVTPVAGATVRVYSGAAAAATAFADFNGDYSVGGLDGGTYVVEASAPEYITKRQGGVAVTGGVTTTTNLSLGGAVSYVYDDLGRLAAVIDPSGEAAAYSYDPAGNLLSVSRSNSSQTSVTGFTPAEGPVGTSVTIRGTGFAATLGQNAVTFNGVPAVVTAATATSITANVPVGTATGQINVTTPSGSAASVSPFKVLGTAAPTITGFTPAAGPMGTVITVNGTNFETVRTDNRVKVNVADAIVDSATPTSLSATLPFGVGSGRVSVATPAGTAVGGDFFLTPAPYTAADLEATGRMSVGGYTAVNIPTAGKVGMVLFDGAAGQRVSLTVTNCTVTNGRVTIYNTNGVSLNATTFTTTDGFVDSTLLPQTATYAILVDPNQTYTGGLTLTLYNVADVNAAITPGGGPVPVSLGTPGQNAALTFGGVAGQRVSLNVSGNTFGNVSWSSVPGHIRDPSGAVIASFDLNTSGSTVFVNTFTLPSTGTYTIGLDPPGTRTGSATFKLNDVVDVTGTISIGGPSVSKTTTTPGQNIRLSFDGAAGQKVSFTAAPSGFNGAVLSILNPDGTVLASGGSDFRDATTLPAAGTYTLLSDITGADTGTQTFTLYNVEDVTGAITAGAGPVPVSLGTPGQNMRMTFDGAAGQKVTLTLANNTFGFIAYSNLYVKLIKPDGTVLAQLDVNAGSGPLFLDATTLPTAGTYALSLDPLGTRTGGFSMSLDEVADVTGVIAPDGVPVTKTTTAPGQNVLLTFDGTAGQSVSLTTSKSGLTSWPRLYIYKPDGALLVGPFNASVGSTTLPTTGTYTILSDPIQMQVGSQTFTLTNVP